MGLRATVRSNEFTFSVEADRPLVGGESFLTARKHKDFAASVNTNTSPSARAYPGSTASADPPRASLHPSRSLRPRTVPAESATASVLHRSHRSLASPTLARFIHTTRALSRRTGAPSTHAARTRRGCGSAPSRGAPRRARSGCRPPARTSPGLTRAGA